ncbi:uncharacterized protein LOC127702678 [Mytilus californianus]|uniref:uncharacterized protein LOC127702678 n=1 Tax=Mytilus californianus TaxID=6549 RepID=UPI002246E8D4|nr:uncharacterized protein LOC127702678 [Mytilus californianus]
MAMSKSINLGEAQIPCVCHLCEDEKKIRWKCQECSLLMCDKCKKKVHAKFKAADEHNVIKIADIGKDGSFKPNLFVVCEKHPEQKICIFCKKCNQSVCPVCLSEKHRDHYFESLKVTYEEKIQSLKYFQDKLKEDLAFHSTCEKELKNRTISNEYFYENARKTILKQEERLKNAIGNETKSRLESLGDRVNEMKIATIKAQNTNVNAQKEVGSILDILNSAINTGSLKTVIETEQSVTFWPEPEKTYRVIDISPIELRCGSIDQTQISEMFGSLEKISNTVQFELLQSYKSKAIFNNIQPCQDGSVWVSNKYSSLRNMELGNEIQQRREVKDISVEEMLESEKGEVILSLSGQSKLVTLADDGELKDFIDFSPYISRPLHITKSGKIVVGICEEISYKLSQHSVRKIIIIEASGKKMHTFEFDADHKRILTYALKATTNINNDLYVIDKTSKYKHGRLLSLAYPNKVIWTYTGNKTINSKLQFKPNSLAVTTTGNIVLLDSDTKVLHIIDVTGALKTFVSLLNFHVFSPESMCIDVQGRMWISCGGLSSDSFMTYFTNIFQGMLIVMSFTGF